MTLQEFIDSNNISKSMLARMLKLTPSTIHYWLSGRCCPSAKHMARVEKITQGKVTKTCMLNFYLESRKNYDLA